MTILFVTSHLNIGGIANYIIILAKALARKGIGIYVASSGGDMEDEFTKERIELVKMDFRTKSELSPKVVLGALKLSRLARDKKIDIIHAHTRVTQAASALASRFSGIPYVTTCHGFFKKRLGRMLFGCWGEKVVAISEPVRASLINDFKVQPDRIGLIRNGIELEKFSKRYSSEEIYKFKEGLGLKQPIVGTIGRLSSVKGHRTFIEAIGRMSTLGQDVEGVIVGDGPEEDSLKELVKELKIEDRFHFFKSRLDTERYLAMMDVFVLPSIKEGLGLSLIEAMAAGRPCVASNVGGISDLIKDGENGLLFPVGDGEALAAAVTRLLGDEDLRRRIGESGRSRARSDFSASAMAEEMLALYRSVISNK